MEIMEIKDMEKGKAYIRINPRYNPHNTNMDWSYTREIMIFDGMSETGNPIMHRQSESIFTRALGNEPRERNCTQGWIPAEIIWNGPKTDMSAWEGKTIIQVQPILINPGVMYRRIIKKPGRIRYLATPSVEKRDIFDRHYMNNPVKLLSATKYHLVVEENDHQVILDQRYIRIDSWALYNG